eukprot:CAMPEP_0116542974 /NCGR_PEP_ID=MMETSP0397-20121206/1304_1 /TAXON_ID=216820 /ORGANISM="Cyclophora tenuis, Strain ECT3854" /LENGTH=288 /DNA_ID=CAMNT_0004067023 /DNA_START=683 /DNA_END=1549 /DNA_ORIENTATION=-
MSTLEQNDPLPGLPKDVIPSMLSMVDAVADPSDLEMELSENEADMVHRFETGWKKFLHENPHLIPKGRRGYQLQCLSRDVKEVKESKIAVEQELQKQLDFFTTSRDRLEDVYQYETEVAAQRQKLAQDKMQEKLDTVNISEEIMSETIPWYYFLEAVDNAASLVGPVNNTKQRTFKPSTRAMALVDRNGDEEDVRLRAFRLDHALLTAQVKMLAREVERHEKTNQSLEIVAKFFTEHNIWGILTKQQADEASVTASLSSHVTEKPQPPPPSTPPQPVSPPEPPKPIDP